MPKDTNNAAYTGQLLYVSSCRMFPNRTFPWHMFHELKQQKIENCNVWWWVVILVTDPAPWTEPSGQWVWLLESSSGGVKDWSSRCRSRRYPLCDIAWTPLSEDVSSQRTAPSLWSAALPLQSCMCVAFAITGWVVNRNNNYNCAETARIKLQILPNAAFPFSPSGFTIWISQTVYCYFWAYPSFYFLVFFLFLHFFSCRFRAVDWADLCRLSSVS